MSHEFWMGVLALPAVLGVGAVTVAIVSAAVWFSADVCKVHEWKLHPKRYSDRANLAAIVSGAKWTRYFWVPGFHVVIARTGLATRESRAASARQSRIRNAILAAYRENAGIEA